MIHWLRRLLICSWKGHEIWTTCSCCIRCRYREIEYFPMPPLPPIYMWVCTKHGQYGYTKLYGEKHCSKCVESATQS